MSKWSFYLYVKVKWTLNIIEEVFRRLLHQEIWKNAISYDCAKWKMHQHQFRLLEAFRMTVWNFRMVMRNQLLDFPLSCSQNCLLVHFAWSREMKIHNFSTLFAIFSISFSWFHSNYLQINSKFRSKPIALLLSLCIWIIINFICSFQFDSSIFFTNLSKSYFEITPKLHKTC